MKTLLGLLVLAQISPNLSERMLRGAVSVIEAPEVLEAAAPVEQWLGLKLVVYETKENIPIGLTMYPSHEEPGEALITPTAVFVWKGRFTQFRSSFELAEFLSHAAAHVRLRHAEGWAEKARMVQMLGNTHAPEELPAQILERSRKEFEAEAEPVAAEFLAAANCAPGPCARFGRLMAAVRR